MTGSKRRSALLAFVVLNLAVALAACGRNDEQGADSTPRSSSMEQRSAGTSDAGNTSSGTSDSSSGASGAASSAGRAFDDTAITTKAKTALLADSTIRGTDIKVETDKGTVTLSGNAENREQIAKAEKIVKQIDGVKTVENRITLKQ